MRVHYMLLPGGVIVLLSSLSIACNAILGVDDVSLLKPDAAVDCPINMDFPLVVSNAMTTKLIRSPYRALTVPVLTFKLNLDIEPDILTVVLADSTLNTTNTTVTHQLDLADSKYESCKVCTYIDFYSDYTTGRSSELYQAKGQGDLQLTLATPPDSTRLIGSMNNLKFRRVSLSSGNSTTEIKDGCMVTVRDVVFDVVYSTAAR